MKKLKLGILISGRGSNMTAILKNCQNNAIDAEIVVVISNKPEAMGLDTAKANNIPTACFEPKNYESNEEYEKNIVEALKKHSVNLVILAGYMKIVGKIILDTYLNQIMNIHPSLLPSFKGLAAQKQTLDYGVKISGVSVHFVDNSLDGGPIILQETVPVLDNDTEESLSNRILEKEHIIYSQAIQLFAKKRLKIRGRKVIIEMKNKGKHGS